MPMFIFHKNAHVLGYPITHPYLMETMQFTVMLLDMFQTTYFMRLQRRMSKLFHSSEQHVQGEGY